MKLELKNNKVFFESKGLKKEIHPFWLRERVNGVKFVDKSTQQRLFDPTQLQENIQIKNLSLCTDFLEVNFNDGASTKIAVLDSFKEFNKIKSDIFQSYPEGYLLSNQIIRSKVKHKARLKNGHKDYLDGKLFECGFTGKV